MVNDDLWSYYFQNEDLLHAYRMETLCDEQKDLYRKWLGLHSGMKILDVGCGTGEFTYFLGRLVSGCEFTGLDSDAGMIESAKKRRAAEPGNDYHFTSGDAFHLPFENEAFDLTVSYTFLTAVRSVTDAVTEMARVTKHGRLVAASFGDGFDRKTGSAGYWPKIVVRRANELFMLQTKAERMYSALLPTEGQWTDPSVIPYLFSKAPLRYIRAYGIGSFFSLSNAALSDDVKRGIP